MTVYTREQWGSTGERGGYDLPVAVSEVYVHHFGSGIQPARSVDEAMARMRSAQAYHRSLGWGDIGYSWCVDYAGNVYEGRGWNRTGAHTYGYNSKGYGICGLFDSTVFPPSDELMEGMAGIIRAGIITAKIDWRPTIVAHRDRVPDTACCGDPMYLRLDDIRALVAGGELEPATDGGDKEEAAVPLYMMSLRDEGVVAVYDGGFTRQVGGAEWTHLTKAGIVTIPTSGADEDKILRAGL